MPYEKLGKILFPLSSLTKDEVRNIAKKDSLPVAEKQESQDICFVTQKNYQEFLLERGQELKPGPIVDMQGKVLGTHRGIIFHTIGQRGGLGISHPTPLYVVSIDPDKNTIVVGEKKDLMAKGLLATRYKHACSSLAPASVRENQIPEKRGALRSNSRKRQIESNICGRTGSNHSRAVCGFL